jgi:hypothetical protein
MRQYEQGAYRCLFLLYRKRFNRLYARDTRRYEVVQVIRRKNGAHNAQTIGGETRGGKPRISKQFKKTHSATRQTNTKHRIAQEDLSRKSKRKDGRRSNTKDSRSKADVAESRALYSHVTRQPIDKPGFLKDSNDKPPRQLATLPPRLSLLLVHLPSDLTCT